MPQRIREGSESEPDWVAIDKKVVTCSGYLGSNVFAINSFSLFALSLQF